jgi:uncharacterized membrane protein
LRRRQPEPAGDLSTLSARGHFQSGSARGHETHRTVFRKDESMIYAVLKTLHLLSIVVWVGGMVFAHFFLRPALAQLEPPARLRLMHEVLGRFFRVVLVASLLTLASGIWMIGRVAKQLVQSGGRFEMPLAWTLMAVLGVAMVAIFMHIRFALYRRLDRAVAGSDWPAGGAALAKIRTWVSVNLALGILVIVATLLASAG